MITRSNISTISYNTDEFLTFKLNDMINNHCIEFWAFINHIPEEDERKSHKHLFIIPSGTVDTFALSDILEEIDFTNPSMPPLGTIFWKHSKFVDWYLYALHDIDYLASKGESRMYHYNKSEFVVSEYDYFNELIHSCDFSQYTRHKKLREAVQSDVSFRDLFANGFIPVQQIGQYSLAYNLLKYGDMYYDKTDRNGRSVHEIPVNTVEEVL